MGYLNAAAINAADDRNAEDLEVPEWGGTVRLMVMTGTDLDKFERMAQNPDKNTDGIRASLVGKCLVDENNQRLYTDADVRLLGKKNAAVLTRIFKKCLEINKVADVDEEADVEDFDETPDEPSTTD